MKRNIILIGTMGSGKSHLGRNLAEAKGCSSLIRIDFWNGAIICP